LITAIAVAINVSVGSESLEQQLLAVLLTANLLLLDNFEHLLNSRVGNISSKPQRVSNLGNHAKL
jgi:hypothetical protein